MTAKSQATMHEEHVAWREEHATWRDEAESWTAQTQRALAALARVEALLRDHGAAVLEHGADLGEHEAALAAHERALGALQRAGLGEQYDPATPDHERWETRHRTERDAHLRARARHHAVLALVERLGRLAEELARPAT